MAWIMPHEEQPEELVNPTAAAPRWIMPHEAEAEKLAVKTPEEITLGQETPLKRVGIGAGQAFNDMGQGLKQTAGMLRNLAPGQPSTWPEEVSAEMKASQPARQAIAQDPYSSAGRMGATVATGIAMSPSARILPAALTGAAMEGPMTPREEPTWGDQATGAGKGAVLGGGGGLLGQSLVSGLGRTKNALRGRFADPEQQNRFRIFKDNQVPASLGDITQNPSVMGIENAAQHIPFSGRRAFMEQQAKRLGEVVTDAPAKIAGVTPASSKEDLGTTLVKSIKDKYAANKLAAKDLYDQVSARVTAVGAPPVPATELANETQKLLSKYPTAFAKLTEDPTTVSTLEQIATGVSPTASKVLGPNGLPIMKAPQLSFDDLRALDSDLGALIRQGRTLSNRGEYNSKTFAQLVEVQNALRKDIENWSVAVGDPMISKGVRDANKFFKENVIPFRKNPTTKSILQDNLTGEQQDALARRMFKLDAPATTEQSLNFLTPEGIQAGRFHLLNQAKEKAMNDALESGYSPSRFLKESELGETGGKMFSSSELGQLGDLQELIRSSRRASSFASDPSTGNRLLGLAPLASMKIPMAARLFSTATQSEAPMRFMLADPRLYTGGAKVPMPGGLERAMGEIVPGRMAEETLRKAGIGAPLELMRDQQ